MTASPTTDREPLGAASTAPVGTARVFLAVLYRDLFVTGRELPAFAAQVLLQPLFLLFVFGRVLTELGYAHGGFTDVLFPGVVAFTAVLTALQSCAFPLVIDFSFTKEIEDRLLAPLPTSLVAVEKLVFATLRGIVSAVVLFPLGVLVLGHIPWHGAGVPLLVTGVVLGAAVGAALGLTLGTLIGPQQLNIVFALVLTPLLFTGATQYPFRQLDGLRWFQVVTALNPLTYVSESLRGAMLPAVPHIPPWVTVPMMLVALAVLSVIGIKGFLRRAID
jgi:ABC-2 type transport system permease protein